MKKNILVSSSGRQVYLIKAFQQALGDRGKVYASDFDKNAKSLKVADVGFNPPPYTQAGYIDWLVKVCIDNNVKLLLTLSVEELLILEKNRNDFQEIGCTLLGGDYESIISTYDKYKLFLLCNQLGIKSPLTYKPEDIKRYDTIQYPILAKPQFGKGSRGHKLIHSEEELNAFIKALDNELYILQEYINGQEYGFDVVNNFNSEFAGLLVRKKISMKNGETYEAITRSPIEWLEFGKKLSKGIRHTGTIDVDALLFNDELYLIDINYRFGGGYIFSHASGADIPSAFISWLLNDGNTDISRFLTAKPNMHSIRNADGVMSIEIAKSE